MSNPYPEYKRNTITVPLAEQAAQPQQEPVAYRSRIRNRDGQVITAWVVHLEKSKNPSPRYEIESLYTTPPARKPLTDEEYEALVEDLGDWSRYVEVDTAHQTLTEHVRQVLAAHGIKGDA